MTDNNKTAHWVGHSKLNPLDTDGFFKREKFIDDIEASLIGNTTEQSTSVREESKYVTRS